MNMFKRIYYKIDLWYAAWRMTRKIDKLIKAQAKK